MKNNIDVSYSSIRNPNRLPLVTSNILNYILYLKSTIHKISCITCYPISSLYYKIQKDSGSGSMRCRPRGRSRCKCPTPVSFRKLSWTRRSRWRGCLAPWWRHTGSRLLLPDPRRPRHPLPLLHRPRLRHSHPQRLHQPDDLFRHEGDSALHPQLHNPPDVRRYRPLYRLAEWHVFPPGCPARFSGDHIAAGRDTSGASV